MYSAHVYIIYAQCMSMAYIILHVCVYVMSVRGYQARTQALFLGVKGSDSLVRTCINIPFLTIIHVVWTCIQQYAVQMYVRVR